MAVCDLCGKRTHFGNTVSHAGNRSRRARRPNLQKVKARQGGRRVRLTVCTRCIKSGKVTKIG
ncbi:MAG TPA: 50S ribosomal protein L28 [Candidatus Fraserbacteria bacterium]|nr:50S ribosomal protein L28 [Candidatus Fraserbacteria bacterium]